MFAIEFSLLAIMGVGPLEMLILGAIGVLLFGKRLPEVGRQLGKGLTEFKRGIHGVESEINSAVNSVSTPTYSGYDEVEDDYQEPTAPKFEPPSEPPQAERDQ